MHSIKGFIQKEKVVLFILFIMLINPFEYGYRIAILLFVVIFFQSKKYIKHLDVNILYIFIFSASYEILASIKPEASERLLISIIPNIFIPSLLFLIGKQISKTYADYNVRLFFFFFISFSFSFIPILSILSQILQDGFLVGSRSMYLIWDKNEEYNATGLGSYFSLNMAAIGLLNIKPRSKVEKRIFLGVVFLFLVSLLCVLRLGSRTQLGVGLISLIVCYFLNFRKNSLGRNIIFLSVSFLAILYIYFLIDDNQTVAILFQRNNMDEYGLNTAGGRSMRWMGSINSIFTDPFGWEFSRFGYAHNFWLDVARVAGVIPLIVLLKITWTYFKLYFRSIKITYSSPSLRAYITVIALSFFLSFFVEPVMEGMYLMFLLFCSFFGFLSGITEERNVKS